MLHVNNELDGIEVDTFTGIRGQCSLQCLGDFLAEIRADVLRQLDADPLIPAGPTLASARTAEPALVDHLEGTYLRVGVVLLVSGQFWPSAERM
jgi:hypothetical protein